ncbi:MAG: MotA/TolQ/ExbB proton channel family protein [Desulfobacterales bacterium]
MGTHDIGIISMILNAGLMVQFVLLLLLLFSVFSWAIIIIKYRSIGKAFRESAAFTDFFWKSKDFSEAFSKSKQLQHSPAARVFRVAYVELKRLSKSGGRKTPTTDEEAEALKLKFSASDNVKRVLEKTVDTETTRMIQLIPFLATTGNATPFIGLFGTVWGIMNSFHGIGLRGSASLGVVAPGISEALIATAAGLATAIPAVIFYNYFIQKIRVLESDVRSFSTDLLNVIERDILPVRGK